MNEDARDTYDDDRRDLETFGKRSAAGLVTPTAENHVRAGVASARVSLNRARSEHRPYPTTQFSIRFDSPGTYRYACTFHPGMAGTVVVVQ